MPDGEALGGAVDICVAGIADLEAVLALQRVAYLSEAKLLNDFSIPPLLETMEDTERQFHAGVFLKAVDAAGELVGSVRGRVENGTLHIGKLMVHPRLQGRGIGGRLLEEIGARCPQPRQELFTSALSARNLSLYERHGFVRFREAVTASGLRMVFLERLT